MLRYLIIGLVFLLSGFLVWKFLFPSVISTGAPPYQVADDPPTSVSSDSYLYLRNWQRPSGPAKVALQVGHWQNDQVPEELSGLKGNTGASAVGLSEWEVNSAIANHTAQLLRAAGVTVDILPTTVPVRYWADVFIAIHADGSLDRSVSGFKAAQPRQDLTGTGSLLLSSVISAYQSATGLSQDPNVSRNMRGYYAFAWWRYDHAVHPMTTAMILETGFLTSAADRRIIVHQPEIAAQGLAAGVLSYLSQIGLHPSPVSTPFP